MNAPKTTLFAIVIGLLGSTVADAKVRTTYKRVAGPVAINARRTSPTYITRLLPGRRYLVVVSGTFRYWNDDGLCDGAHIIYSPDGGGRRVFPTLKFSNPDLSLIALIHRQTQRLPAYKPNHVYHAWIQGNGRPLSAVIQDQPGMYIDNHGALSVRVYELRQTVTRPPSSKPPKTGLTNVSVNRSPVEMKIWDHGSEDGDRVKIYINGKYYRTVTLKKKGTVLRLPLRYGRHTFQVKALNQGRVGPNTASMRITGVVRGRARQKWSLKRGQLAGMTIHVGR